jgi:hypothetical protein
MRARFVTAAILLAAIAAGVAVWLVLRANEPAPEGAGAPAGNAPVQPAKSKPHKAASDPGKTPTAPAPAAKTDTPDPALPAPDRPAAGTSVPVAAEREKPLSREEEIAQITALAERLIALYTHPDSDSETYQGLWKELSQSALFKSIRPGEVPKLKEALLLTQCFPLRVYLMAGMDAALDGPLILEMLGKDLARFAKPRGSKDWGDGEFNYLSRLADMAVGAARGTGRLGDILASVLASTIGNDVLNANIVLSTRGLKGSDAAACSDLVRSLLSRGGKTGDAAALAILSWSGTVTERGAFLDDPASARYLSVLLGECASRSLLPIEELERRVRAQLAQCAASETDAKLLNAFVSADPERGLALTRQLLAQGGLGAEVQRVALSALVSGGTDNERDMVRDKAQGTGPDALVAYSAMALALAKESGRTLAAADVFDKARNPAVKAAALRDMDYSPRYERLTQALDEALAPSNPDVLRLAAVDLLTPGEDEPRLKLLATNDSLPAVREHAIQRFIKSSKDPNLRAFLESIAQTDPEPSIRQLAADAAKALDNK